MFLFVHYVLFQYLLSVDIVSIGYCLSNINKYQNDNVSSDESDCVKIIKTEERYDTSFTQNIEINDFKKLTEIMEKGFQKQSEIIAEMSTV